MKVFYQEKDGLPINVDVACLVYGAINNGFEVKPISYEELRSKTSFTFVNVLRQNIFIGSHEFMREIYNILGIEKKLLPNSNRESTIITLKEAISLKEKGERFFIKPLKEKLFTGFVVDGFQYPILNAFPAETKVYKYEVIDNIISEWRLFVHKGKIIDARNYAGDFTMMYDKNYASNVLEGNSETFPIAYTIDIGVIKDTLKSVVIEYNDIIISAGYGLDEVEYFKMYRSRYFEIIKGES